MYSPVVDNEAVELVDNLWNRVRSDAKIIIKNEPVLERFIDKTIVSQDSLESSVACRIAERISNKGLGFEELFELFMELNDDMGEAFGRSIRLDLTAVLERDPACNRIIEALLNFKGFQALVLHRYAHHLWTLGRKDMAYYLQSAASACFAVDIHPAAHIGVGIMLDHATGIVVGETATVGDNSSILHDVTLGGSGKEGCDRHPKVGSCVMIGAGAKILGNIQICDCVRVAAGSVVLKSVPKEVTVAGVPARIVGTAGCSQPANSMNQSIAQELLPFEDD